MIVRIFAFAFLVSSAVTAVGQKLTASNGFVSFYSHAVMEDIRAEQDKGSALLEPGSGDVAFMIPIKEFRFAKSLMQEHFNEKYMESDRYPKATFQGKIEGFDVTSSMDQEVTAKGKMTMHGVTQDVQISGKITRQGESVLMASTFVVKLEDYKIKIPQIVWQNIAEQVEVNIKFALKSQN
ncbi:MAG: YceI family protein [Chryseolinea sp.]